MITYEDIYTEGYYMGLCENDRLECKNQEYNSETHTSNKHGESSSSLSISTNNPNGAMAKYGRYVKKCKEKGKTPVPFEKWIGRKAIIGLGGIATLGTAAGLGIHHHKKKKAMKESYADGYYAALCDIDH